MDKIQEQQLFLIGSLLIYTGAVAMIIRYFLHGDTNYTDTLLIIFGGLIIIFSQLAKNEDYVEGKYTDRVLRANKR